MKEFNVRNQYLATCLGNLISIAYGAACGWPSASILILKSNETPLESGPLTTDQVSWIGSFLCIGGFSGNLIFGWLSMKYGRKKLLMSIAIPQIASWLFIIFAKHTFYLYASRFLSGFAGGATFVLLPMYVTEISEDRVRGSLGSLLVLSCNIGFLIAFTLGNYCSYEASPLILLGLPFIFLICFAFFPETPFYLMKNNREIEAEKSLRFYRNVKNKETNYYSMELIKCEMEKLKGYLKAEQLDNYEKKLSIKDFTNPIAKKAFFIGLCLVALNQGCGVFAMLNYTASIFEGAGSDLTPNMSAIIIGIIQLFGSYAAMILVDRLGRKFLLGISSAGNGIGLTCLGLYLWLKHTSADYNLSEYGWIPIVSFAFSVFISSWGVLTLPFVVIAEIMPEKVRTFGTSFCMSALWIFAFIMIKYFPILSNEFGMHGCVFLFAGCSFAGTLFIIFILPETKGKSLDAIMDILAGR